MLSIITVNYKSSKNIDICLGSIIKYEPRYIDYEFIIVDNNSNDSGLKGIGQKYPFVKIIHAAENRGFAYGNNIGIKASKGDYILLLNPDTYLENNSIEKLYARLKNSNDIDFAGPQFLGIKKTNDSYYSPKSYLTLWKLFCESFYLYRIFNKNKIFNSYYRTYIDYEKESYVESMGGAAFLFRRSVIDKIGLLDENYFMYYEEIDYCLQAIKSGYKLLYYPESKIIHIGGDTTASLSEWSVKISIQSFKYYFKKNFPYSYYIALPIYFAGSLSRAVVLMLTGNKKYKKFIYEIKYLFIVGRNF